MPLEPGQKAPLFTLPLANAEGEVSLADAYRDQPVFLALFRGLYCPFCRHQIARLAVTSEKLRAVGVATLGVVATPASRARLYFRFHHARIPLGADPDLTTHRAYGVPGLPLASELLTAIDEVSLSFAKEHGIEATLGRAHEDINAIDGYRPTAEDHADFERHQAQLVGQFLIGRDGVIRWVNIERVPAEFPAEGRILEAARAAS